MMMIWFFMFMSFISDFLGSDNSLNSFNDDFGDTFDDDWEDLDDNFTADDSSDEDAQSVSSNCSIPLSCIALYNYEVCNSHFSLLFYTTPFFLQDSQTNPLD